MKNVLKFFAITAVILGFSATSFGQNSDNVTATAQGTIITPISITKNADMQFGTLVAAAGTVVLNPGAAPTYNGVAAYTTTDKVDPSTARFTVNGDYSNTYAISISDLPTVVTHTDNSTTMALSAWTSTNDIITFTIPTGSGTNALNGTGTDSFEIGATLTVAANQTAGVYTSSAFTVTVDYN